MGWFERLDSPTLRNQSRRTHVWPHGSAWAHLSHVLSQACVTVSRRRVSCRQMKTLNAMLIGLVASTALATDGAAPPQQPVLTSTGAFFALSVADIQASGRWYAEKLGLVVTMRPPREGPGEVMVLEGGGLIVELIQHDEGLALTKLVPPVDDAVRIHGFFKAGVLVEDVDATRKMLEARGVPMAYGPFAAKDGRRANFIIRDNAGNFIHFFGK